jgi:hypothetical protein
MFNWGTGGGVVGSESFKIKDLNYCIIAIVPATSLKDKGTSNVGGVIDKVRLRQDFLFFVRITRVRDATLHPSLHP